MDDLDPMRYEELLDCLYDSATDSEKWQEMLEYLNVYLSSTHIFIAERNSLFESPITFVEKGFENQHFERYQEHFYQVDVWSQGLLEKALNTFHPSHAVYDDKQFLRSEIYNDFARPVDIRHSMGCLIQDPSTGLHTEIGIMRNDHFGQYSTTTVRAANRVVPHIVRALTFAREISSVRSTNLNLTNLIEHTETSQAIISRRGEILHSNAHWDEMLSAVSVIRQNGRHLRISDPALRDTIFCQLNQPESHSQPYPSDYYHPYNGSLLRINVKPTRYQFTSAIGQHSVPAYLLTVQYPRSEAEVDQAALIRMYSLTPAEACVVKELCRGLTTHQIAEKRQTSVDTARKQIKSCLSKTGTSHQAALVAKVLTIFRL